MQCARYALFYDNNSGLGWRQGLSFTIFTLINGIIMLYFLTINTYGRRFHDSICCVHHRNHIAVFIITIIITIITIRIATTCLEVSAMK